MAKLDPRIKAVADPIYLSDTKKYARLIVWIKQAQKYNYSTDSIVAALSLFQVQLTAVGDVWWPYLDTLIKKCDRKANARAYEVVHRRRKEELRDTTRRLFDRES